MGNEKDNVLTGNAAANTLLAGAGNDTVEGGAGTDILWGQAGADVFVFKHGTQTDIVADFAIGQDKLDLTGIGFANATAVKAAMTQTGADIGLDLRGGEIAILFGVNSASLTAGDFIL